MSYLQPNKIKDFKKELIIVMFERKKHIGIYESETFKKQMCQIITKKRIKL
jgi:hypothetical protein